MSEFQLAFPTGRDSPTFRDNGTEVLSLPWDKETMGQAKYLAKGQDGPGRARTAKIRDETVKIRDGTRDKTGQS